MQRNGTLMQIKADLLYSVCQAARYFGVHRCTIYDYIAKTDKPLLYTKDVNNKRMLFLGQDLMDYKASGLPRRGRPSLC